MAYTTNMLTPIRNLPRQGPYVFIDGDGGRDAAVRGNMTEIVRRRDVTFAMSYNYNPSQGQDRNKTLFTNVRNMHLYPTRAPQGADTNVKFLAGAVMQRSSKVQIWHGNDPSYAAINEIASVNGEEKLELRYIDGVHQDTELIRSFPLMQ